MNAADCVGGLILDIEEKDLPSVDEPNNYNVVDAHLYTIVSTLGRCDVTLHVSHNGYYGGFFGSPEMVAEIPPDAMTKKDDDA